MFDVQLQAGISKVNVKVKSKDGITKRTCRIVLEREFDAVVAAGIGSDARDALLALETGGMESCVLPIDGIDAEAMLTSDTGECVKIRSMVGVKATGTRADSEEDFPPGIKLEFEFAFAEDAWVFFGRHCGATAVMLLKRRQLEIASPRKAAKMTSVGHSDPDLTP